MAGSSHSVNSKCDRASDRNYPVYVSARLKILFSPDNCTIQCWISPVVRTYLGVLGTTVSQFLQQRITSYAQESKE